MFTLLQELLKKKLNKDLKKHFANIYKLCNTDINKFVLMLQKSVDPDEYMDDWKKFIETSLPVKKSFTAT